MSLLRHQRVALSGLALLGKILLLCALVSFIIWALTACSQKREDIMVYHESSTIAASISASLEATDKHGKFYLVAPTGSMEPTLHGGDYVVAVPTPFAALAVGMIVNYTPTWNEGRLTCHRIVAAWPTGGWVMEGDSAKNTAETKWVLDETNYVDHVISIHRFP